MVRSPCPITKSPPRNLPGIYYCATSEEPVSVKIATTIPDVETAVAKRFPSFESILGTRSFIHECLVTCVDAMDKPHRFLLAYQEHPEQPPNRALLKVLPGHDFCGELVVMRAGKRSLVVNMKGKRDMELAEEAVRRFLLEVTRRRARNRRIHYTPELPDNLA
ncbi:hypothetical protein GY45DRAFT_1340787 [Cubamyces sp. BRFM 1775]|nr:hypothetical protein GY45DRAFT_1340787 [Cubamyces sp. BRFM 1775]